MQSKALLLVLPLALVAGGWLFLQRDSQPLNTAPTPLSAEPTQSDSSVLEERLNNEPASPSTTAVTTNLQPAESLKNDLQADHLQANDTTAVDPYNVGLEPLSDQEYAALQSQLHSDSGLLLSLLEEFRYNTNPKRALQLAALLGEHNRPEVIDVAAELAYSGDPASQKIGLDLLSRLQPNNDRARDIAIDLLGSENNPELLVSTMNVLATPARKASATQRDTLLANITLLSSHNDYNVRSHSVALIGRWNKDTGKDTLVSALSDSHPQVRARAASALRGVSNPDYSVINGLLTIAENTTEEKTTRQSALYSLKEMPLSSADQQRFNLAQTNVRQRRLNN